MPASGSHDPPVPPVDPKGDAELDAKAPTVESEEDDDEDDEDGADAAEPATTADGSTSADKKKKKKKKSKRQRAKEILTGKSGDPETDLKKAISGLTPEQIQELVALNPSLAQEVSQASGSANPTPEQTADLLKKMNLQEIMTGLAAGGKNAKDMGAYKFWQTQPVPRFGEDGEKLEEGPLKVQTVEEVSKDPASLVAGFEWVNVDLKSDEEIKEVYELLNGHYVEDDEAMFRFNYSPSILRW